MLDGWNRGRQAIYLIVLEILAVCLYVPDGARLQNIYTH